MDEELRTRIERLEDENLAYSTTLCALVMAHCNTNTRLRAMRERVCGSLERLYETGEIKRHDRLQRAIATAEELFRPTRAEPKPDA